MTTGLQIALTFALCCVGLWLFNDTLLLSLERDEMARKAIMRETLIEIGQAEGCTARVSLAAWPDLNRIGVYRWVVACEDARK